MYESQQKIDFSSDHWTFMQQRPTSFPEREAFDDIKSKAVPTRAPQVEFLGDSKEIVEV